MTNARRKFTREPAQDRRDALIAATVALIAERGIDAATVRAIAERANVTQGLIRHYFESKEELLNAAYAAHMSALTAQTGAGVRAGDARMRLREFVAASLNPPVASAEAVTLWAGFITLIRRDARMRATHESSYRAFRDIIEGMIAEVFNDLDRPHTPAELRRLAIACNAVIDGLWLEGGALPDAFVPGELAQIGQASVGAILNISLTDPKGPKP